MSTHQIQAAFARKREQEHKRNERTEAVDRYYTHWGKQTSKYETWTKPEYYQKAEEKFNKAKEKKEKEKQLNERRERLKKLFDLEKIEYEKQVVELQRRSKSRKVKCEILEKIDQNFKSQQEEKRRLELEAKLYGRLRHGVDDESLLYDSRTNNQVLAKLNWLDKQIENQVEKEKEEKELLERNLRMQEEIRKTEENHKQRQQIREKEIREIRALQEKHVAELKERDNEAEFLKSNAQKLKASIEQIESELNSIQSNQNLFDEVSIPKNLRNMKTMIRNRSECFCNNVKSDIALLSRVRNLYPDEPLIQDLIENYNQQLHSETLQLPKIESMYESEAKENLQQCEEIWKRLSNERRIGIKNLLKEVKSQLGNKFYDNQMRQKELIDIRTTHLASIENSNEQLKALIKEDEISPRSLIVESPRQIKEKEPVNMVSDSFKNLNLDCLGGDGAETISRPNTARSQSQMSDISDQSQGPRFGRKKVAWT